MHNEKYTPPQIAKMQIGKSLPHQFNIRAHIYLATAYTPQLHFTYIQHSALEFYFYSCATCLCLLADLPFIFRLLGNFFPTSLQYFFFGIHLDFRLLHLKCYAHILCWHSVYILHNSVGSGK